MNEMPVKKPISVWAAHVAIWTLGGFAVFGILLNFLWLFTKAGGMPSIFVGSLVAVLVIWICCILHKLIVNRRTIARPILMIVGIVVTIFVATSSNESGGVSSVTYSTTRDVITYATLIGGITTSLLIGIGAKSKAFFTHAKSRDQQDDAPSRGE